MHPVNYDITVRTMQLELERANRRAALLHSMPPREDQVVEGPRRLDILVRRFLKAVSPPRTRRATAD
jgi:hypothetical protein